MRIIGGIFRGRRLAAREERALRPTGEKLRESLFNILLHGPYPDLAGARIGDVFAGTGALGLEALSRGAGEAVFFETAGPALTTLRRNIESLGMTQRCRLVEGDACRPPPAEAPLAVAFLDPPYGEGLAAPALSALAGQGWLRPGSLAVVETGREEALPAPAGFRLVKDRSLAKSRIRFFECTGEPGP